MIRWHHKLKRSSQKLRELVWTNTPPTVHLFSVGGGLLYVYLASLASLSVEPDAQVISACFFAALLPPGDD